MKRFAVWIGALLCAFLLCGCQQAKIPEGMTQEKLEQAAKAVLQQVHEKDYAGIWENSAEIFQKAVSAEELEAAVEGQIGTYGAFTEYVQQAFGGSHGKGVSGLYGTAVITAKYENGKAVYTLSFDSEYRLVGFYVK